MTSCSRSGRASFCRSAADTPTRRCARSARTRERAPRPTKLANKRVAIAHEAEIASASAHEADARHRDVDRDRHGARERRARPDTRPRREAEAEAPRGGRCRRKRSTGERFANGEHAERRGIGDLGERRERWRRARSSAGEGRGRAARNGRWRGEAFAPESGCKRNAFPFARGVGWRRERGRHG